jgi:hypothetical protein
MKLETQKSQNVKIMMEAILTSLFYAKVIICHECMVVKQTLNGKFHKEVIERLIAHVRLIIPEFLERWS